MKLYTLLVFILLTLSWQITAQEQIEPLTKLEIVANTLFWTSDSQQLLTQSWFTGSTYTADWIVYSPQDDTLITVAGIDERDTNTLAIDDVLRVDLADGLGKDAFLFPSSNGRFAITAAVTETNGWSTVLLDLTEDQRLDLGFEPLGIEAGLTLFNTTWSDNSEAVVVASSALNASEPGFFHYITGYADPQADLRVEYITRFDVGERSYTTIDIFDISQNGQKVLLWTTGNNYPLIIWDANGDHQVIEGVFNQRPAYFDLKAAMFVPDDENHLLVVDYEGLVRYSLLTGETEILNPDLNSTRFRQAKFSPNGEWLALIEDGSQNYVYLFDVRTVLVPQDG